MLPVWILAIVCLLFFPGCGPRLTISDYIKTHESAATAIPAAKQMEELFGNADHFITDFGRGRGPKLWNTHLFFGERYELTMQVEVDIDYSARAVKTIGEPTFYLFSVKEVEILTDGREMASFDTSEQREFGLSEWEQVYSSGGDFSSMGITINPDPVPTFGRYVSGMRKDRVPITLVDPDPT